MAAKAYITKKTMHISISAKEQKNWLRYKHWRPSWIYANYSLIVHAIFVDFCYVIGADVFSKYAKNQIISNLFAVETYLY